MIHILIAIYFFITGVIFGYNIKNNHFAVIIIYSLLWIIFVPIELYSLIINNRYIKDIWFLIRLLLGLVKEDRITILRTDVKKYVIRENIKTKGILYRYLAKKVIKKYDL